MTLKRIARLLRAAANKLDPPQPIVVQTCGEWTMPKLSPEQIAEIEVLTEAGYGGGGGS